MFESIRSDGATNEGTLIENSVKRENLPNCEEGKVEKLPEARGGKGREGRKEETERERGEQTLDAQIRAGVVWPLLFVCTPNQDRTKNRGYHVTEPTLRSIPQLCISSIQFADCHRFFFSANG